MNPECLLMDDEREDRQDPADLVARDEELNGEPLARVVRALNSQYACSRDRRQYGE